METKATNAYEYFKSRQSDEIKRQFSNLEYLNWTVELIKKYENRIDWGVLSSNAAIPVEKSLFLEFADKWDWNKLTDSIRYIEDKNDFLDILRLFKEKINWGVICRYSPINPMIVDEFSEYINWTSLCRNDLFNWSYPFIEKYKDKIDWNEFSNIFGVFILNNQEDAGSDPINEGDINNYIAALHKYENRWNWDNLSESRFLENNRLVLETFKNRWNWELLICNESIDWDIEMVQQYNDCIPTSDRVVLENSHMWENISHNAFVASIENEVEIIIALL